MEQHTLTEREQEVAAQLLHGRSNKEIAAALHISERTVEFHLGNIYQKLDVASRVELILLMFRQENARLRQKLAESTGDSHAVNSDNQNIRRKRVAAPSLPKGMFKMFKPDALFEYLRVMPKRYKMLLGYLFLLVISPLLGYLLAQEGLYAAISFLLAAIVLGGGGLLFVWFWPVFGGHMAKRPFFPSMLKRYKAVIGFLYMIGVSLFTGYLMVQQGLYFGISYLLLALVLGAGSLLFGWFWRAIFKNRMGKRPFFLFLLLLSIMLGFVALLDASLIHTIARSIEKVSIELPGLYNEAQWLQNEAGEAYLFRRQHRVIGIPYWLLIVPFMTLFALLGDRWRRQFGQSEKLFTG